VVALDAVVIGRVEQVAVGLVLLDFLSVDLDRLEQRAVAAAVVIRLRH
jgi:hypothetical protein